MSFYHPSSNELFFSTTIRTFNKVHWLTQEAKTTLTVGIVKERCIQAPHSVLQCTRYLNHSKGKEILSPI